MFCEKCGTKNDKNSKFCEKCGNKLEMDEVVAEKKEKQRLSQKQKNTYCLVGVIAIILIAGYYVLSNMFSAKNIGDKYFQALAKEKYDELYQYHEIDSKSKYVSKNSFKTMVKENVKAKKVNLNYSNKKIEVNDNNIVISYLNKDTNKNENVTLYYVKDGKKYSLFDNYKITSVTVNNATIYNTNIEKNIKVYIPESSTGKLNGVEINKESKKCSSKVAGMHCYEIDEKFGFNDFVELSLESGLKFSKLANVADEYRLSSIMTTENMNEESSKIIEKKVKEFMEDYYTSAIKGVDYKELTKKYSDELSNSEYSYTTIKNRKLTSFNVEDIKISRINVYNNLLYITFSMKYKYRKSTDTIDKEGTDSYIYIYYNLDGTGPTSVSSLPYIY